MRIYYVHLYGACLCSCAIRYIKGNPSFSERSVSRGGFYGLKMLIELVGELC